MTPALGRHTRVTGEQRDQLTAQLAERYARGESIRSMADDLGRSYGWVQGLLKEAGVTFRARGGATRGEAGRERAAVARPRNTGERRSRRSVMPQVSELGEDAAGVVAALAPTGSGSPEKVAGRALGADEQPAATKKAGKDKDVQVKDTSGTKAKPSKDKAEKKGKDATSSDVPAKGKKSKNKKAKKSKDKKAKGKGE